MQVEFDPEVVTYEELLALFWKSHDPTGRPFARQYSSLILASGDKQLAAAQASAERYQDERGDTVATRIEKLSRFYPAEDYHQKYYLRQDRTLVREFRAMFDDEVALRESTAAARVNGYVAGYGTREQLEREMDGFGLTDAGRDYLTTAVGEGASAPGCAF